MDNLYIARQLSSKINEIKKSLKQTTLVFNIDKEFKEYLEILETNFNLKEILEQYNLKFDISPSENTLTIYNKNLTDIFIADLDIDYLFYLMPDNTKEYLFKIKKG